jgi:predicted ATPase
MLGHVPELFPVLYGLYTYHCVVGNHREGEALNRRCLEVAAAAGDEGLALEATMLKGMSHFFFGELSSAREYLQRSSASYDAERFGNHCYLYGQDPGMVSNSYLGLTLAMSGEPEQAAALSARSLAGTRALEHPFSLAYGLNFASWLALLLDETERGLTLAEEAHALAERQRSGIMLGMSRVLIGWASLQRGEARGAVEAIGEGVERFKSLGAGVLMPYWHGLLGLAELEIGNTQAALAAVDAGRGVARETEEHWSTAELHRVRARVLAATGDTSTARVELECAGTLAREQAAVLFERRASDDLASLGSG